MNLQDDSAPFPSEAGNPASGLASPWLRRLLTLFAFVGICSLIVSILLTCADIVWRRVVGGAFVDTVDLTKLCLVTAASFAVPYGFAVGSHVTVDLLAERLPRTFRRALDVAISLVAAVLIAFLAWLTLEGARMRVAYGDTTQNLQIPLIYYWSIFLLGLCLTVVACLVRALELARGKRPSADGPLAR